jgi:hypothetical protein
MAAQAGTVAVTECTAAAACGTADCAAAAWLVYERDRRRNHLGLPNAIFTLSNTSFPGWTLFLLQGMVSSSFFPPLSSINHLAPQQNIYNKAFCQSLIGEAMCSCLCELDEGPWTVSVY